MSSSEQSSDLQSVNQSNIPSNNIENSDSGGGVSISEVSSLDFNMLQSTAQNTYSRPPEKVDFLLAARKSRLFSGRLKKSIFFVAA